MLKSKKVYGTAIGLLSLTLCAFTATAWGAQPRDAAKARPEADRFGGWASDRIVVKLAPRAIERRAAGPMAHGRLPISRDRAKLNARVAGRAAAWRTQRIRRAYPFEFGNPKLAHSLGLDQFYILEVPKGTDTPAMAAEFNRLDGDIESATVDVVGGLAATFPNDANFSLQYALNNTGQVVSGIPGVADADIDAPEAWDIHTGLTGAVITIAFLDSGLNAEHEEFVGGRVLQGFNAKDPMNPTDTTDGVGHGTHVTGIATANANNGVGIAGVTWGANILPVRVVDLGGFGTAIDAAVGLTWAVDHGADICNMSLQYCSTQSAEALEMLEASAQYAKANGVLVVAAAGNRQCALGVVAFPGAYPETIAVSATTNKDLLWSGSSTGPEVELSAPGELIWSAYRLPPSSETYRYLSGTSMATPHVSGLAALVWSYAPYLSDDQLRAVLENSVDDLGTPGRDQLFGYGRINAYHALMNVPPPIDIDSSDPPADSIDARQPSDLNGSNPTGWDTVTLTFDGDATGLGAEDFEISVDPPGTAPDIDSVSVAGSEVTLFLATPVPTGAWTTFTHVGHGSSTRIGYLPGDVNGSGTTNERDVIALIDALNQPSSPLAAWSADLDRTGFDDANDVIRLLDLLLGNGSFEPYQGASLP
ncbi:MAG: S8 family serine peptidase [Phycisphaerae bacterium]|nr:S8 family serine peptidase [Phycisphaerae bacterium]